MKKLIAMLLALALALSVCGMMIACGEDPNEDPGTTNTPPADDNNNPPDDGGNENPPAEKTPFELFVEAVQNTTATSVTTTIKTVNEGVELTATTTLNATTNKVEYTVLNKLDIENTENTFSKSETLDAKAGENTVIIGDLQITAANLADVKIENGVLTATVTNVSAFFGATITGFTTAEVTMTTANNVLTGMTVSYTTTNGSTVTMTVVVA